MVAVELTLTAHTSSVGAARRFLVQTLHGWAATRLEWPASQVVSELATNAVIHAGTAFTVALIMHGDALRIEVRDGSVLLPRQRRYGLSATTGRGLALVGTLTKDWGVQPGVTGKTVWCVLSPDNAEVAGEPDLDAFLTEQDRAEVGPLPAAATADERTPTRVTARRPAPVVLRRGSAVGTDLAHLTVLVTA